MSVGVVAFLLARLNELELFQGLGGRAWHEEGCLLEDDNPVAGKWMCSCVVPALVSADITSKRQLIELAWRDQLADCDISAASHDYSQLFKLLASPFAGHPDYREEWKP